MSQDDSNDKTYSLSEIEKKLQDAMKQSRFSKKEKIFLLVENQFLKNMKN